MRAFFMLWIASPNLPFAAHVTGLLGTFTQAQLDGVHLNSGFHCGTVQGYDDKFSVGMQRQ